MDNHFVFLTAKEVSNILRLSEQTIVRWANTKKIPAYKFGLQWRFESKSLNTWISGQYYTGEK